MEYKYTKKNLLQEKEKYEYSLFSGLDFLNSYFKDRETFLVKIRDKINNNPIQNDENRFKVFIINDNLECNFAENILGNMHNFHSFLNSNVIDTFTYLSLICETKGHGWKSFTENDNNFNSMIARFEITKRIYNKTDSNFKPFDYSISDDPVLYLAFSSTCYRAYKATQHLSFLNAMLKSDDIICSLDTKGFDSDACAVASSVILAEKIIITELTKRIGL